VEGGGENLLNKSDQVQAVKPGSGGQASLKALFRIQSLGEELIPDDLQMVFPFLQELPHIVK